MLLPEVVWMFLWKMIMHVVPLGLCPREQNIASQDWLFLNPPGMIILNIGPVWGINSFPFYRPLHQEKQNQYKIKSLMTFDDSPQQGAETGGYGYIKAIRLLHVG